MKDSPTKTPKMGICRLCLESEVALQNSHIISEFNYEACYDEIHRFRKLSSRGPKHEKYEQQGFREYLLCQNCETRFSVWENYAKKVINDGGPRLVNSGPLGYVFDSIEYAPFRLYGLSILWRMGISTLEMFSQVNLGKHEEKLRRAILEGNPLRPWNYPFILVATTINGKFYPDVIVPPSMSRNGSQHIYRVVISGIVYVYSVASHRAESQFLDLALTENGRLKLAVMPVSDIEYLYDHLGEVVSSVKKAKRGSC